MLRVTLSPSAAAAKSYYTEGLSKGDYYVQGQELPGTWHGLGAAQLGIDDLVDRDSFYLLCENRHPTTGEKLTARMKEGRRVGYDFTFNAPKSASLLYAQTQDDRILSAFRHAVDGTMKEIEAEAQTRVRLGGRRANRTTGNLVWGEFVHLTARPVDGVPDPHLHAHCFVFNATFDQVEGRWKAAEFGRIKSEARYYEAAFHARFARSMRDHGFALRRTGDRSPAGWEIAGISAETIEKFSCRTSLIEERAQELGLGYAEDKAALGAKTRAAKKDELSLQALQELWDERLSMQERSALRDAARATGSSKAPLRSPEEALLHATEHLFSRASVTPEKTLLEEVLRYGVGDVSVAKAWDAFGRRVGGLSPTGDTNRTGPGAAEDPLLRVVERDPEGDRVFVTSRNVLAEEQRMLAFARNGRGTRHPLVPETEGFSQEAERLLNDGQQAAVRHVWRSRDRVTAIRGGAGVGKTTLMREAVRGIEANGQRVYTFAPSADASRGQLREEGFGEAETVKNLLDKPELHDKLEGQVIWIDEASLMGTRTLGEVFELAERKDARVVLAGDIRQHRSVERGDALRLLETRSGVKPAEVREIVRQRGAYKKAVAAIAAGDLSQGFEQLDAMGAVRELSGTDRHEQLAADYLEATKQKKSALVVSPTHAEGEAVTGRIREGLRAAGKLGDRDQVFTTYRSLGWTDAERKDASRFQPGMVVGFHRRTGQFKRGDHARVLETDGGKVTLEGPGGKKARLLLHRPANFEVYEPRELGLAPGDRIRITKNGKAQDKKYELNNGSLHSIKGFTKAGDLELANGRIVSRHYGHLAHGYCTTSHASQGKTVDRVFIAQGSQSLPASNQEQFYVSVSRAKETVTVYTDDKAALREAIGRAGDRRSAVELIEDADSPTASRASRLRQHAERLAQWAAQARAYASQAVGRVLGHAPRGRPV